MYVRAAKARAARTQKVFKAGASLWVSKKPVVLLVAQTGSEHDAFYSEPTLTLPAMHRWMWR